MKNIEVEIRSFISKTQYQKLKEFFTKKAKLTREENQETHYLSAQEDLRVQKSDNFCKIWLKAGKIHDDKRKELEIYFDKKEFNKILELFENIGLKTKIIWLRKRLQYKWQNVSVSLDFTKGYGYILELEKMSATKDATQTLINLKKKLEFLNIELTPKEIFEKKFSDYEKNWKNLI